MEIIYQLAPHRSGASIPHRKNTPSQGVYRQRFLRRLHGDKDKQVDSANKHGILLEMVEVLTDLDLLIPNHTFPLMVYGSWTVMFHVTDQLVNKITDESLMLYIQQAVCETRRELRVHDCKGPLPQTALEITGTDRPGLLSEISAVLLELSCNVTSSMAWTHNYRAACIIYVEDACKYGPIGDPIRLAHVQEQVDNVVERRSARFTTFPVGSPHTERRLHQLMYADRDYERCEEHNKGCDGNQVSIGRLEDKGYWVVNVRSRDRPKLLFDTVCVLTDMHYVVFHGAIRSKGSMADQEYFVRRGDGITLDTHSERQKLTLCLIAAIERRVWHASPATHTIKGLRVDLHTQNRTGLLSDVTRVFRENGLSISRVELGTQGDKAVGSFYVVDYSGQDVNPNIVELVREEAGGSIVAAQKSPYRVPLPQPSSSIRTRHETHSSVQARPRFSLRSKLWSHLERLSCNFHAI